MNSFYIGKTYIREMASGGFNPEDPRTWNLDNGINGRFRDHKKRGYGKNGLIVVAVVTKDAIPEDCRKNEYITHHEEYALTLEKRLIQYYKANPRIAPRIANKTTQPGEFGKKESIAYAVYMTFTMTSWFWSWWHGSQRD